MKTAISPTRQENYPEWYQQVIRAADLAEVSPVRGCMTIKPWGYALWENIQRILDSRLKATGHKNLYFPLLIPASFLEKEAEHIDGFAKECAVVTHTRMVRNADGKLIPDGELEEPYIIRPTSETIIGEAYSRWIQSWRDLPLLMNQWANVMRWEMRTRMFLRTSEFLWQEGHTAHATVDEAQRETLDILNLYTDFVEGVMAMPVIRGEKSASERFPGADNTYCIEAMMQDRKALQAGTSHYLGQNFARAFNIKFLNKAGVEELAYTTSWGVSTRLIGGLIMTHSDDDGLQLPPRLAATHIVILPVIHKPELRETVLNWCEKVAAACRAIAWPHATIGVEVDQRELTGGEKAWSWVKKGVPLRIELGAREAEAGNITVTRRDRPYKERTTLPLDAFLDSLGSTLDNIQTSLFQRAEAFRATHTRTIDSKSDFYDFFTGESAGGFALAHWDGNPAVEEQVKKDLNVTIRCLPLTDEPEPGVCPFNGGKSAQRVIFAKSY